jgi:hypothetical protein
MPPVGFKPTISAGERPKTYVLDRAATGTGCTTELVNSINVLTYFSLKAWKLLAEIMRNWFLNYLTTFFNSACYATLNNCKTRLKKSIIETQLLVGYIIKKNSL